MLPVESEMLNQSARKINMKLHNGHLSHAGTEHAEHIQIIITSSQKVDNVIPILSGYWFKH